MESPNPAPTPEPVIDPAVLQQARQRLYLQNRVKRGASWFYWIAGLSIISTIAILTGGTNNFVIRLGITQLGITQWVDDILTGMAKAAVESGSGLSLWFQIVAIGINLAFAALFIRFGVLGNRGQRGWVITGIVLYTLDALLFLALGVWLGAVFHAIALYNLVQGLRAMRQLEKLEPPQPAMPSVITPS